jgi:hypothetical protein
MDEGASGSSDGNQPVGLGARARVSAVNTPMI